MIVPSHHHSADTGSAKLHLTRIFKMKSCAQEPEARISQKRNKRRLLKHKTVFATAKRIICRNCEPVLDSNEKRMNHDGGTVFGPSMLDLSPRQQQILAFARKAGGVGVDELASHFEVTPQTIRKDLNEMCDARHLTRTRGGAMLSSGVENVAYESRRALATLEKQIIGRLAASLTTAPCSSISAPQRKRLPVL
jgi:DNA-binding MarR family transcriptional regulator